MINEYPIKVTPKELEALQRSQHTLKQRLERVFIIFSEQIVIAEHDNNSYHNREELMYALGIRFARNTLSSEFEEIFGDD